MMDLQKRLENVIKDTLEKRTKFTINRFCDSGEVWALQSNKNKKFVQCLDLNNKSLLPIFPEIEFAKLYQTNEWENTTPISLELGEFFYEIIPFLIENDVNIAILPNLDLSELNIHNPKDFALKLQKVLDESYGELYELDYL